MRPAGARCRPRRLQRRLPRGRPRPQGRAGRALRHLGWRVPERGLHPIEGAAACGRRDGRGEPHGRPGRELRRAHAGHRQAARPQREGHRQADRRPGRHGQDAQGHHRSRPGSIRRCPPPRSGGNQRRHRPGEDGQQEGHRLQERHHRCRQPGRAPALHARRPARGGLHRRAGVEGSAQAYADPGRRHHWPGNGHRVQHPGRAPGCGGNDGRPDAGRRPRPRQGLAEDERQALRQHHAQDQDGGGQGHARRHRGDVCRSGRGRYRARTADL